MTATLLFLTAFLIACSLGATLTPNDSNVANPPVNSLLVSDDIKVENDTTRTPARQAFDVTFDCGEVDQDTCNNAKATTKMATDMLEETLFIKHTITISVSFELNHPTKIARGKSGTLFLLRDDDNVIRSFPHALAKQLGHHTEGPFTCSDIVIQMNPKPKFPWHFASENKQLEPDSYPFLDTVLHEMVHGLGFLSSWAQPRTSTIGKKLVSWNNEFGGFIEYVFDRYLYETKSNMPLSARTEFIHKIANQFRGLPHDEADSKLKSMRCYKKLEKDFKKLLITPRSLAFHLPNGEKMILETSLNPYVPTSTLSHADRKTYHGTDDDLMTYNFKPSQRDEVKHIVLGPKTIAVLETLGYPMRNKPISQRRVQMPDKQEVAYLFSRPTDLNLTPSHERQYRWFSKLYRCF